MNALLVSLIAQNSSGGLGSLLPLLLIGPLIYMMIVPQRKQKKKHQEFLASLQVGAEVVTSGGIHGTVTFLENSIAHVEVDSDVVIRVSKGSLSRTVNAESDQVESGSGSSSSDEADAADGVADVTDSSTKKASKSSKN